MLAYFLLLGNVLIDKNYILHKVRVKVTVPPGLGR